MDSQNAFILAQRAITAIAQDSRATPEEKQKALNQLKDLIEQYQKIVPAPLFEPNRATVFEFDR